MIKIQNLLTHKDLNFLILIAILLISSKLFNQIRNELIKKWASFLFSLILILIGSDFNFKHLIITLIFGLLLSFLIYCLKFNSNLPFICFTIAFLLLTCWRIYFVDSNDQTNLALMMILLRSISLAFDLQEFDNEFRKSELNLASIISYLFCYCGIIIGPFFRFRVYRDWLLFHFKFKQSLTSEQNQKLDEQCNKFILGRMPLLFVMLVFFLIGNKFFFPLHSIEIKQSTSLLNSIIQAFSTFYIYRARLYIGFILSEIVCVLNYLGVYPIELNPKPGFGPTAKLDSKSKLTFNYSADTIRCFNSFQEIELSGSVKESLRCWNQTVQFWLYHYLYHELKSKNDLTRFYLTLFIRYV